MDDFLRTITSDFGDIARSIGFRFNQYSEPVDWDSLDRFVVDDIVENADVQSLSMLVASVLSYNIEKMSVSKKIFRLSQLIIDFLLHYKKNSIFKLLNKVDSMALCELCGKMFIDVNYLKYHCFRRHKDNSCNFISSPKDEYNESLKSEIVQLQTQLNAYKSTFHSRLHNSNTCQEYQSCNVVHKNILSYHLISQPGDNPMQTQEMFWKQKYDSLEENYNSLKCEYDKNQNTSKTAVNHRYQQCDLYKTEQLSKYVQTDAIVESENIVHSPKRPPRNIDVIQCNENNGNCSMADADINHYSLELKPHNYDVKLDKDFYELKKLRLEARMNINENNICEDHSETSSDYVNSLNIILILGQTQINELFKNDTLLDLIKFDVKEVVNKRLEEFFNFIDENVEEDNILLEKRFYENQETWKDYNTEQHNSPKNDGDKMSIKKNKTVMSKLKKKALRFSKIFSPDSKNQ
ncbi:uncharacterized protein LOC112692893 isoform X2 [Sipha flava]|uniref:Uncharacterized protein LOC112692893 isoform X2 n=1 Tax=Sipha flava TaxID=143950 RepID=A0A2S2QZ31_9HEMI|nr:uncharacterized protein LOC112692893 isoform X2 [Sipha flava]